MTDSKRLLSFALLAALFAGLIWSWSAGAPRPPRAFDPPAGVLALSTDDAGDPALNPGLNDTFYFGGTRWAPDSSRWEAIPDSVWTFETGVGSHYQHPPGSCKEPSFHAQMEGWVGVGPGTPVGARFRRLGAADFVGTPCVGATAGLGGNYSFWAGFTEAEADSACWATGQGYGNNWDIWIVKDLVYDDAGCLKLSYSYHADLEPGWDYAYVIVDTTGALPDHEGIVVRTYTGPVAGVGSLTLTEGVSLRSSAGPMRLKFRVVSDGAYSDEDGDYATSCGAFGVDDVHIWNTDCGGAINDLSTFETGTDGWVSETPPCTPDNYWSRLASASELPWPPGYTGGCDLGDSVLVFYDPATGEHPLYQASYVVSPWIDLKAAGKVGFPKRFLELGGFYKLPLLQRVYVEVVAQWYPDTCAVTGRVGTSPLASNGFVYYFGGVPICASTLPRRIDLSAFIPPYAEQVRVAVGAVNWCRYYGGCEYGSNSTPWFDDIRFGVATGNTIQSLVDAAAPGDTVLIGAGTYLGFGNRNITFRGKEVVLLAPDGPDLTVIDCQGAARGFVIDGGEDSTLVIDGFTVRNGKAPALSEPPYIQDGGGIYIGGNARPTLKNCIIETSQAHNGGGIYVDRYCGVLIERCTLEGDSAYFGGGLFGGSGSKIQLSRSTIRDNKQATGITCWGMLAADSCTVARNQGTGIDLSTGGVIRSCAVEGNAGDGITFGDAVWGSAVLVQDCTVRGNQGVGIDGAGGIIERCTITENADIGVAHGYGSLRDCIITRNAGGGVYALYEIVEACVISSNVGTYAGVVGEDCQLRDCVISGNRGQYAGVTVGAYRGSSSISGCTVSGNHGVIGGGIFAGGYHFRLDIRRSIIRGNCADSLGADVYAGGDSTTVTFHCCALDSSGIGGPGHFVYDGSQVFTDPLFCSPASCFATPTTAGDYHLTTGSPCLPESSPCDSLIGALGMGCSTTGVPDDRPPLPLTASLRAYPNPFRADVTIIVGVPVDVAGTVEIFDVRGRLVREFEARAGETALRWDGRSEQGAQLPQGLYFVRLHAGAEFRTQRVILIR